MYGIVDQLETELLALSFRSSSAGSRVCVHRHRSVRFKGFRAGGL